MAGLSITQNFREPSKPIFKTVVQAVVFGGAIGAAVGAAVIGVGYGVQALNDHTDNQAKSIITEAFVAGKKTLVYGEIGESGEPKVFEIKCEGGSVNAFRVSINNEGEKVVSETPLARASIPMPLCPQ